MQEMDKDLIAKMLRAVLQSNKNGVALPRVQTEYKSLTGDWIPFKQLGYPTLEAYLRSIPTVVKVETSRSGEIICSAVACTETAQIAKLVARQRTAKKNVGRQVNCQMRIKRTAPVTLLGTPKATLRQPGFSYETERLTKKHVFTLTRNRGGYLGLGKPILEVAHTAVIPIPGPGVPRELGVQENTAMVRRLEKNITLPPRFQKEVQMQLPRNSTDTNVNRIEISPGKNNLPAGPYSVNTGVIQNNIKEILRKYSNGIWLSKLPQVYKNAYRQDLNEDMIKQLKNWPHVCVVEKLRHDGQFDVLLYPPMSIPVSAKSRNQEKSVPSVSSAPDCTVKPLIPTDTPSSNSDFKQRVMEILMKYSNGLWANALPKVFEDTFKMKLPEDVLQNLDLLTDICTVDYVSDNPQKAILYAKVKPRTDENRNDTSSVCIQDELKLMVEEEYSWLAKNDSLPVIPSLVIPNEASQSVLVVELNNTNEVVIRYVGEGYSVAHERMEDEMKEYYSKNSVSTSIQSVKIGQLVAVNAEEDAWLRAQIVSITADKLEVCYVDYGFNETITRNKIRKLCRQFCSLSFQAAKCRLAGLEAFCEDRILVKAVESKACGKILALEILEKSEIPLVVLYDTSGEDDININATCLKELYDKSLELIVKENISFSNVRVANVCSDGTVFCQVPSKGLTKLYEVLQKIENYFHFKQATSEFFVSLPFCGKICLIHCKGRWARVEITNLHSSRTLDIKFLDYGMVASVKVSELREIPLQFLKETVTIPPQVLKCCLADLPHNIGMWTPDAVLWLRDTVLNSSSCSIKIVKMDKSKGMVQMYLFTSSDVSDLTCSVNRQITNTDLWKHRKDVFLNVNPISLNKGKENSVHAPGIAIVEPQKDSTSTLGRSLPEKSTTTNLPPLLTLPKPGEHMDVYVSVACHPSHFVVQPWQVLHNLEVVMEEMIIYYSTTEENPVAVEKNKIYAAKIENKWYRVLLKGILTNGLVSVYQLDYGRHELVSCRKVQPLIDRFKLLPFQAIRTELAGVKCDQWSEEASIVFRNHVEKKPLVALIQTVYESTNPWDRKIVAYIVDTSLPDTDVWIHDLMSEYLAELSKTQ